jgi:DNA-binding NarL/FixJ family response regulator
MPADPQTTRTSLILAPASIWRDALVSLVRAQPQLHVSQVISDFEAARAALACSAVDVVIAEHGIDEPALLGFIAWLREAHAAVRCVVAVDTQLQQTRYLAAGAHATLLKGCLDEASLQKAVAG